jgi:hypothetical protein
MFTAGDVYAICAVQGYRICSKIIFELGRINLLGASILCFRPDSSTCLATLLRLLGARLDFLQANYLSFLELDLFCFSLHHPTWS